MTAIANLKDTLAGKITTTAQEKAFTLAQDDLPGPIQTVIGDYLDGVTVPLGSVGSLTVDPHTKELKLDATVSTAHLTVDGTADQATLTLTSTEQSLQGASITLTFSKVGGSDSQISLELHATMGDNLEWPLDHIWSSAFSWSPASNLALTRGDLDLTVASGGAIDFAGRGSLLYDHQPLANGVLLVKHDHGHTGVLVGAEVTSWSPGNFWEPLKVLTFNNSGLVFSTLESTDANSLVNLGLFANASDVPALQNDFVIKPGMAFFTSLRLTDHLECVANFLGNTTELDLFAFYGRSGHDVSLVAGLYNHFSAGNKGFFQFDSITLDWENPENAGGSITAAAQGHLNVGSTISSTPVTLGLSGTINISSGDFSIQLDLRNWTHPFEIPTLTIEEAQARITVGAQAEGVTAEIGGEIRLQNPHHPQDEFELGLMIEVADFEVPTGIALWMDHDRTYPELDLTMALSAAFEVDISPATLRRKGDTALAEIVQVIDDLIKVQRFQFWFVEGADLPKMVGDHGPFPPGFGLQADFRLLNQEDVDVSVTLSEKPSRATGFSGFVIFQEEIRFGHVVDIARWDHDHHCKVAGGPELAIAATRDGIVLPEVNGGKPVYFYASAYISFLDIVQSHIYGIATTEGLFEFEEAVQIGAKVGSTGAWAGRSISLSLNPSQFEFKAAFKFNFGWKNVHIPALRLWGITLIPAIPIPDFDVAAALAIHVSTHVFEVKGALDFDLFGAHLHWGSLDDLKTILHLDLDNAISSLGELATKLLEELGKAFGQLLEGILDTVEKFVNWVKGQLDKFVDGLKHVAHILYNEFKVIGKKLAQALHDIGAAAAEITRVLVDEFNYAIDKVEGWMHEIAECAVESAALLLP